MNTKEPGNPGLVAVSALTTVIAAGLALAEATETKAPTMKDLWLRQHLTERTSGLPFSFTYDGQPSAKLLAAWPGQWAASFTRDERQKVRVTGGQELMERGHTVEIRDKPGVAVIAYRRTAQVRAR